MLVLTRFRGQSIVLGEAIRIVVDDVQGQKVRLGIQAPDSVPIWREEVLARGPVPNRTVSQDPWARLVACQLEVKRLKDRLCQEAGARAELEQLVREAGLLPRIMETGHAS